MRSFYQLLSTIYFPRKSFVGFSISRSILLVAVYSVACLIGEKYLATGISEKVNFLSFVFLVLSVASLNSQVKDVLQSKELILLKKIGVRNTSLLVILIYKLYSFTLPFGGVYICLFFARGVSVDLLNVVLCCVGGIFFFVIILSYILLYNCFLSKAVIATKYIFALFIMGFLIFEFVQQTNNNFSLSGSELISMLSNLKSITFISRNIVCFGSIQLIAVAIGVFSFVLVAQGRIFYLFVYKYTMSNNTKALFSARHHTRKAAVVFFIRDISCLFRETGFAVLQIFYVVATLVLMYVPKNSYDGLHLFLFVAAIVINSFHIQNLYKIDAFFVSTYKKIPLTFSRFLLSRVCNASVIGLCFPAFLLTCSLILGKTSAKLYLVFLLILVFSVCLLCLYWSSIILPFFPEIKKTDMPLGIGFIILVAMIPLLLFPASIIVYFLIIFAITGVGIKRGNKIWRKIIREC